MKKLSIPAKYSSLTQVERRKIRERYCKLQNDNCYYCNSSLESDPLAHIQQKYINMKLFPKGFLNHPIHLHHSHKTDLTLGAVHARCNAILWQYHNE